MTALKAQYVTLKRWTLKHDRHESELASLVRDEIAPHYAKLPGCIGLGLLRVRNTRKYIALQYWLDIESYKSTTSSEHYRSWQREYGPILKRWDELAIFEEEWECDGFGDIEQYTVRLI